MEDLEYARSQWLRDEPLYGTFGKYIEKRLGALARRLGIPAAVSTRPKEIDSLLKKLLRKPHHSYETLGDKLGARVVVKRLKDIEALCLALPSEFACGMFENTADRLAEDQVGYLSIHVDIGLLPSDPQYDEFSSVRGELQVRTLAQNLWSEMAHDISYKGGTSVQATLKRRLHLLAALIEIADNDYQHVEDEIAKLPGMPELQILRALERQYYKLASKQSDTELSLQVIRLLWPLYGKSPEELAGHFERFFLDHRLVLEHVFADAPLSDRSAFLFQPEILMIYDQLEVMQYQLRSRWVEEFPERELERIALRFGHSFL